jgi:hypothetical protein
MTREAAYDRNRLQIGKRSQFSGCADPVTSERRTSGS